MSAATRASSGVEFNSKEAVELDQLPGENAQTHAKADWWEHLMVRISDQPGLTQIARGQTPLAVLKVKDTPLSDLPELHPCDDGYNRSPI